MYDTLLSPFDSIFMSFIFVIIVIIAIILLVMGLGCTPSDLCSLLLIMLGNLLILGFRLELLGLFLTAFYHRECKLMVNGQILEVLLLKYYKDKYVLKCLIAIKLLE